MSRGQGAGAPRARRRLRPDRLGVRHRRGAARRRPHPPRAAASGSSRPPRPATRSWRSCSTPAEIPLPDAVVTEELAARRQEMEQQLALRRHDHGAVPRRARSRRSTSSRPTWRSGSATRWPPSSCSTRSPSRKRSASTRTSSPSTCSGARSSPGQNPDEFVKHMVEHNHIPEMVSEVVRGKALALIVEGATVTDAAGQPRRAEEPPPGRHHRRARERRAPRSRRRREDAGRGAGRGAEPRTRHRGLIRALVRGHAVHWLVVDDPPGMGSGSRAAGRVRGRRALDARRAGHRVRRDWSCRRCATCTPRRRTGAPRARRSPAAPTVGPPGPRRDRAAAVYGSHRRRAEGRRPGAPRGGRAGLGGSGRPIEATAPGRFVLSAVNGLIGDRLRDEGSRLAIDLGSAVDGRDVPLDAAGLAAAFPDATGDARGLRARPVRDRGATGTARRGPRRGRHRAAQLRRALAAARLDPGLPAGQHRSADRRERGGAERPCWLGWSTPGRPGAPDRAGRPLDGRAGPPRRLRGDHRCRTAVDRTGSPTWSRSAPRTWAPRSSASIERGSRGRSGGCPSWRRSAGSSSTARRGVLDLHDGLPDDVQNLPTGALPPGRRDADRAHRATRLAGTVGDCWCPTPRRWAGRRGGPEMFPGANAARAAAPTTSTCSTTTTSTLRCGTGCGLDRATSRKRSA